MTSDRFDADRIVEWARQFALPDAASLSRSEVKEELRARRIDVGAAVSRIVNATTANMPDRLTAARNARKSVLDRVERIRAALTSKGTESSVVCENTSEVAAYFRKLESAASTEDRRALSEDSSCLDALSDSDGTSLRFDSAQRLWEMCRFSEPHDLVVEDLALALGAIVIEAPLWSADAWMIRRGQHGIIRISDRIPERGRKRFAVLHELAHWLWHRENSQIMACTRDDMRIAYKRSKEETAANEFAAEMLMPEYLFKEKMKNTELSWSAIRSIADYFEATLTATAMRYVDVAADACAFVQTTKDGKIKSYRSSGLFRQRFRIKVHSSIGSDTAAFALSKESSRADLGAIVPSRSWVEVMDGSDDRFVEESIRMDEYSITASLLRIEKATR